MSDIISRVLGNFGVWQLRTVLIIYLCKIPASWFMACIIFTAPAPWPDEYHCKPPPDLAINTTDWVTIAHPPGPNGVGIDHCSVYEDAFNLTMKQEDAWSTLGDRQKIPCQVFEHKADFYSLVMQFDLVCDREIFVAWSQYWHLFGILLGAVLATKGMNFISPRRIMLIGMICQIICGCLTGYLDDFSVNCLFRTLSATCCALMFTAGQAIFSDITGGRYRAGCIILYDTFWSIGVILLPGLSSFFFVWSHIYLAISLPTFILIGLYWWIPDAPRWLLKRGHITEVEQMLLMSVEINERHYVLPSNLREELQMLSDALKTEDPPASWWELWGSRRTVIHFVAAHLAWAVFVINFMGMLLNIRSFGKEYVPVNTIITGFSEIIGCFLALHFTLTAKHKWRCAGVYNIVAGLIGCLGWLIPDSLDGIPRVSLWMLMSSIAKAGVSLSQSMLMAGTAELVPANQRQIFVFSCVVWSRIWLLSAPFIGVLKNIDTAMSLMAYCLLSVVGGICTCCFKIDTQADRTTRDDNQNQNNTPSIWTIPTTIVEKTKL